MNKINVVKSGDGSPLVLVHGWGWHAGVWGPFISQLEKKYQVFAVDLPGFGESPVTTQNYSYEEIVPLVLAEVPAKAHWLGWSLGGLFAAWAALNHPERVSTLTTIGSSPKFIAEENWPGLKRVNLQKFANLLLQDTQKALLDFLELQLRGSPNQEKFFLILSQKIQTNNKDFKKALLGGLKLLHETDLRTSLSRISCPNLHIFGYLDTIVPTAVAQFMRSIPFSHCEIIKSTGHMPFLSHSELCFNLLDQFLSRM